MLFYLILGSYVAGFSCLIPIFIGLLSYKILNRSSKTVFYFLITSLVSVSINTLLANLGKSNLFAFHIYQVFEFCFVSYFYSVSVKGLMSKLFPYLVLIFTALCIFNFFYIQKGHSQFNSYTRSLEAIIIIIYAVIYLLKQSSTENSYRFGDLPDNWVNIALLIFYSCTFFVFAFANQLLTEGLFVNFIAWTSYNAVLLLENILFSIAFYKCRKQPIISLY